MTDLLLAAVSYLFQAMHIAWSSLALTIILRNAPVTGRWTLEMKKPWACNVCMPLYTCAAMTALILYTHHDLRVLFAYLPAYAMTNISLDALHRAVPKPVPLHIPPDLFEHDDAEDGLPVTLSEKIVDT